jgi:AraC-like DNA-binding protein
LSDLSIAQIATMTGYYDQSHFTKQFKKILGITPNQYRQAIYKRELQN